MGFIYEYSLLLLACTCVLRELRLNRPGVHTRQVNYLDFMKVHEAWLQHVRKARNAGLIGMPHIERRNGQLCVVGMGRCEPVSSVGEGIRRIEDIESHIAGLFATT